MDKKSNSKISKIADANIALKVIAGLIVVGAVIFTIWGFSIEELTTGISQFSLK